MKVCVTGGTGFVGSEVVRQLQEAGHEVRLLTRHPRKGALVKCKAVFVPGDISDPASLKTFCSDADAMIHLVGIISEAGRSTFENVHALGTQNVVEAAKSSGLQRFIHMSALGTRANAVSEYHQTKWRGEESVRQSGLAFTIFRPSLIYGARDQFTNQFAKIARRSPFIPIIGKGDGTFQPIPVENVAHCFVRALDEPRSIGNTSDLGGPEVLTFNDIIDAILASMEKRRWKLHLPTPLARCMAALLEFVFPTVLRQAPPLNRSQITMLLEKTIGDVKPAWELFHFSPPPFREGLDAYLRRSHRSRNERG